MSYSTDTKRHGYSQSLADGTNSGWIVLPHSSRERELLVSLFPSAGAAMTLEFTLSDIAAVLADSAQALVIFDAVDNSEQRDAAIPGNATAFRVSTAGAAGVYEAAI